MTVCRIVLRSLSACLATFGGLLVADRRVQRRHDRRRRLGQLAQVLLVGHQAVDAAFGEQPRHVGQQRERLEDVARHHRDVHVELEGARQRRPTATAASLPITCAATCVTASGSTGIDLARHDRAARLQVGQRELAETGQRARPHPADVVGDLGQRHRDRLAARRRPRPARRGPPEPRKSSTAVRNSARPVCVDEHLDDLGAEAVGGVEAGADRGAADGQLTEPRQRGLHPFDAGLDLTGVAAELLAQRHRHGVHQVRAAGLDDGAPLPGLGRERLVQHLQRRNQVAHSGFGGRDVGGGREGVVGRLRHVHVVVGVHGHAVGRRDAGDHLVGVHVRAGARTGLEHVDRELVVVLAVGDLGGGGDDRVGLLRRQQAEVLVHLRAGALEQAERADLGALQAAARDREVLHGTLGLGAPQRLDGHPDLAHGVVLDAVFGLGSRVDSAVGHLMCSLLISVSRLRQWIGGGTGPR